MTQTATNIQATFGQLQNETYLNIQRTDGTVVQLLTVLLYLHRNLLFSFSSLKWKMRMDQTIRALLKMKC